MNSLNANGISIHYKLEGRPGAPVILFANSIGTDFRIWDEVAAELAQEYRLLRYDMRGHGLSDVTPGPYSMTLLAQDALALLDALEIEQAHVCGLSIGGMMAQQLAATQPKRLSSAVFCDTAMRIGTEEMWNARAQAVRRDGLPAIADAVLERWFTAAFRAGTAMAPYRNMLRNIAPEGYAACCEAIRDADLRAQAQGIELPALVVVGAEDVATSPAAAGELAQALPNGRLEVLPGAAHIPCVEQPQALANLIRRFLREVSDVR
jgi:3-oxoadipate enol-lactonase